MDFFVVFVILACGYCALLFFDFFFKSCLHYPYMQLLDNLGIKVGYFSIKWKTKAFNRLILKWGNSQRQFWNVWFTLGLFTTLSFLPITIFFLLTNIVQLLISSSKEIEPVVAPIVPGLNLPVQELGYYSLTLLICSVVHEMGHALAAVYEDVGFCEFGCNVYFILPVAYVSLATDKLSAINLKKQLKIFTAGVWHNLLLSFFAYLFYCSLPSAFSPFYQYGSGVSVTHISTTSPLQGSSKGLFIGNIIVGINNCPITNENDWYNCLNDKDILKPAICISADLVHSLDESVPLKHLGDGYVECCDPKNNKNMCFEYIDIESKELELPGHVCLPGRTVMEQSSDFCTSTPHKCPINNLHCFKPVLPNSTYLFKIITRTRTVIYLGHPGDLFHTIEVSSYVKTAFLPISLPDRTTKLLKYITVISLGLAFVNVLPFVFMDGQYIIQTAGLILFKRRMGKRQVVQIVNVIVWISTIILLIYLSYSFLILIR